MLFNSFHFLVFFPVVYAIYLALGHRWQNRALLVASYVFYGSWDWRFLLLILLSTGVDYVCGRAMPGATPRARRNFLLASLVTNLGLLGVFKYFDFFATSLAALFATLGWRLDPVTLDVVLPVGISFYTFQTLSYTIDVYRGRLEPEPDLLNFSLFVAFFPQLVAGPIERAEKLLPQIRHRRRITRDQVASGLWMIAWGFFLKLFMADNLAPLVDDVFGRSQADGLSTLVGVYAFAFQIFGDFAGYSFIAKGLADLMGIELSVNFLFPYFVTNPRDFWHHWHISLSSWLRDYLYIPLGGNRGSRFAAQRNLMLTMLLGGLWHGAGWTFVLWGAFHGSLLAAQRSVDAWRDRRAGAWPTARGSVLKILLMFQVTCLGWLIFRARSVGQVQDMFTSVFTNWHAPTHAELLMVLQLAFYTAIPLLLHWTQSRSGNVTSLDAFPSFARVPAAAALLYALLVWGNYGGGQFIYFQF